MPRRLPHAGRPGTRLQVLCGVAGPAAFVGAWLAGGALRRPEYSPVSQAISQLARSGSPHRSLMTAGFVAFGVLVPAYAPLLGRACGSRGAQAAATVSGVATLAVAALPLSAAGGRPVDTWHAVAAGTGYAGQVLAPLLGAGGLGRAGRRTSYAVSAVALASLAGSVALPDATGLLQRTGLTVVDAWFAAVALAVARGRLG